MKFPHANRKSTVSRWLAILVVIACALVATPLLSRAQPETATITVTNNSNWVIRHLYLSPTDQNNWGPDQLNDGTLNPGGSFTISNATCSGSQIKVISEDADGCFLAQIVDCTDDASWTITSNAVPYCGN